MSYAYRYKVNEQKYPEIVKKLQKEKMGNGIAFYITQLILKDLDVIPPKVEAIIEQAMKPVETQQKTTMFEESVEKEVLDDEDTFGISL